MNKGGALDRLSWQRSDWLRFQQFGQRLPHALLISGQAGLGKLNFALSAARFLLCELSAADPCGQCDNCRLVDAGNHPDLHLVFTERLTLLQNEKIQAYAGRYLEDFDKAKKHKPRRIVSVDQIRELITNSALSNHSAVNKVVVIAPAESMNINASNALLKLLEEPPENTILMLVSSEPELLPITVRSRCVPFVLHTPNRNEAMNWLELQSTSSGTLLQQAHSLSAGAPLAALTLLESDQLDQFDTLLSALEKLISKQSNAIEVSDQLAKMLTSTQLITWLQTVIRDVAASRNSSLDLQKDSTVVSVLSNHSKLQTQLSLVNATALFKFYDALTEYKRHDIEQLNQQLLTEQIVMQFYNLCASKAVAT